VSGTHDVDAMWRRIEALAGEAGMSIREVARKTGVVGESALSAAKTKRSTPSGDTLVAVARVLGVTAEYLLTGEDPVVRPAPNLPDQRLDRPALALLHEVAHVGLSRWLAEAPRDETPTLGEVLDALELLRAQPQFSRSDGAPIDGWGAFFRDMRRLKRPAGAAGAAAARALEEREAGGKIGRKLE
jgi:transcriptional regulator with XRE-family HTH domain